MNDSQTLLVGIANPQTLPHLMEFAAHLAVDAHYEVTATHIVTVGEGEEPLPADSEEVRRAESLLRDAVSEAEKHGVMIDTFVESGRTVHEGLLSAVEVEDAAILLIGYRESTWGEEGAENQFDDIVHRVARSADCHVAVAKFRRSSMRSVVIPAVCETDLSIVGPIAKALARSGGATVRFLQVVKPGADPGRWQTQCNDVMYMTDLRDVGEVDIVHSARPMATLMEEVNTHDLAIVATPSRPSLTESIFGSAAERIAANAECSVVLVRPGSE